MVALIGFLQNQVNFSFPLLFLVLATSNLSTKISFPISSLSCGVIFVAALYFAMAPVTFPAWWSAGKSPGPAVSPPATALDASLIALSRAALYLLYFSLGIPSGSL